MVGRQLVDLLVLALKDDERTLTAGGSSVRAAHLLAHRDFRSRRFGDPDLDPETISQACGISMRYLHEVFRDTNQTSEAGFAISGWRRARKRSPIPPKTDGGRNRLPLGLRRSGAIQSRVQGAFGARLRANTGRGRFESGRTARDA